MPKKYFCAHCDREFVPETTEDKPRCPVCMRRGGIQPVQTVTSKSGAGRKSLLLLALVLVAAGIGYTAYRATGFTLEETPPLRPLEARELAAYLERDQLSVGKLEGMFVLPTSGDWSTEAQALASSIRRKSASWSLDHPLTREVFTADETLAALDAGEERVHLYPLEAAAAMTAVLRRRGLRAMVAETWDLGEQAPPDPSGLFGYFLVALDDTDAEEPAGFFDPWGGRRDLMPSSVRVLRDTEAIAAGLGTNAARIIAKSGDAGKALPLVESALSLDPVSPSLRSVHGMVLLETGGVTIGAKELEAALELRPDGPRQLNLVQLSLAQAAMLQMAGEGAAADAELDAASQRIGTVITRWPRYSRAHLVLAMLHFGTDEPQRARAELEIAEDLDPTSASLWALWGQYDLSQEDYVSAAARVNRAVALDPENWQLRLQAARALIEAGDERGAQTHVQAALDQVSTEKRDELKQYLSRTLGPGALGDESPSGSASGALVLPEPSVGGSPAAATPTDGDPSRLRLRDPDQDLELDLGD